MSSVPLCPFCNQPMRKARDEHTPECQIYKDLQELIEETEEADL